MDLKINAEYEGENNPIWDIKVKNGIAPIIYGEEENVQTATLACFLEKTSIPQLPDMGVPWTDYLTSQISFGELDAEVRQSIDNCGKSGFRPDYIVDGEHLTLTVVKEI